MIRRIAAATLFASSAVPLAYGALAFQGDALRGGAIAAVSFLGMSLSLHVAAGGRRGPSPWLKLMAVALAAVIAAAGFGMWYYIARVTVPLIEERMERGSLPAEDRAATRQQAAVLNEFAGRLCWLSAAAVLCGAATGLLPAGEQPVATESATQDDGPPAEP